jgi:voltage-gated potassium channel Kch
MVPSADAALQAISIIAGLLLIATPFIILRRISMDTVVTTETVLGAISVYLLIGFSFAFIYSAVALLIHPTPFFSGVPNTTLNSTLFFSYTTLTTVGYGDLVPAGSLGQTFAMLEALFGQIYLVLIVARLVSLCGQERRPRNPSQS